jgi:hypothetical protein
MRLFNHRGNSLCEQPAYRAAVRLPSCSQFFHASQCAPCIFVRTKAPGGSCADLQGPIPAPREDVNAAKSADMSERSEV